MGPFGGGRDPLEEMMGFSKPHQKLHGDNKGGSYVCQTFVSSSTMGPDGKMKQESYFENTAGENKNGHTISETKQAYKNNDGVKRIAEERMLNDRGHKVMKEQRRGGEVEQTNHYYNMDEEDVGRFHQDWGSRNQETKFLENVSRHAQQLPYYEQSGNRALGYEPRREQPRREPVSYQPRREELSYQPRRQEPVSYQPRREEPVSYQSRREEPMGLDYRPTGSRGSQASRQPQPQPPSRGSQMSSSAYRGSQNGRP